MSRRSHVCWPSIMPKFEAPHHRKDLRFMEVRLHERDLLDLLSIFSSKNAETTLEDRTRTFDR